MKDNQLILQVPLILQKGTNTNSYYELQKEGVQFLQTLSDQNLRIVFNVATAMDIHPFVSQFTYKIQTSRLKLDQQGVIASLTLMCQTESVWGKSSLLVIKSSQSVPNAGFMMLGYLVASLFVYHNETKATLDSQGLQLLTSLSQRLSRSHIDELQIIQQLQACLVHYGPSLLCVIHHGNGQTETKNEQGFSSQVFSQANIQSGQISKKAMEAFNNCFPSKATFCLSSLVPQKLNAEIWQMKEHIVNRLPARKILNHHITGATVQHICYQLCLMLNEKGKKEFNLAELCRSSLRNHKNKVVQNLIAASVNQLVTRVDSSRLPMSDRQLFQMRDAAIEHLEQLMSETCMSCMDLDEYLHMRLEVQSRMVDVFGEIQRENWKNAEAVNKNLVSSLEKLEPGSFEIEELSQILLTKLKMFNEQAATINFRESLIVLITKLMQQYVSAVSLIFAQQQQQIQELKMFKLESIEKVASLQNFNGQLQKKYLAMLSELNTPGQLQSMKETLSKRESKNNAYKKQITDLKRDNKAQQDQLLQLSIEVDQLYALIDRYENIVEKDKSKSKSKCEFANLIRQLNQGIDKFHRSSDEIDKFDDMVKDVKKELDRRKEQILQDNDRLLSQIQALKNESELLNDQKERLVVVNDEAQQTIKLYEKIVQFNKNGIEAAANQNINQKVLIAEMESKIMLYRKAIELMGQYFKKGKTEPLTKFTKVLNQPDIKQLLMSVIRK